MTISTIGSLLLTAAAMLLLASQKQYGAQALPLGFFTDWYYHEEECRDIAGNRDLHDEVARVCTDCQNLFRGSNIADACRKNCFWNEDFKLCVHALQLSPHLPEYIRKIHIIKVG